MDERIVAVLKERAVRHGVSAEEEHRRILIETLEDGGLPGRGFIGHLLSEEGRVDGELSFPVPEYPVSVF